MSNSKNSLAVFLSGTMQFIGVVLFFGGLTVGVILTLRTESYYSGYGFFEEHSLAFVGLPLIATSLTFGLPFAAVGAYMSAKLRAINP
jgi:hypothetical protein